MFNEFPYTDLHNINLDWFLEQFKKVLAEFKKLKADFKKLENDSVLTEDLKIAMLQIAQKVAYIDVHGQTYYDALYDALYPSTPPSALTNITAVYTQSGPVYETTSLNDLKTDLVVTALYDNGTSETVNTYTLSGTLTIGTSTITVTYGGKMTTFSVIVSANWKSLIDNDISGWYYYDNASYSGDTITIAPAGLSWNNYVKPVALFQYSYVKNKRVRVSGSCELTGYSNGNGFSVSLGTFTAPSGVSQRKAYVDLSNTVAETTGWLTESGTFTFDTESYTLSDVLTQGTTPSNTEWVNVIIYLNANSGCVATINDVTVEYLDE